MSWRSKSSLAGMLLSGSVFLCALLLARPVFAAEFEADMSQSVMGRNMQFKVFVKGKKMRMESGQGVQIMDMDRGTLVNIIPSQQSYMEITITNQPQNLSWEKMDETLQAMNAKKVALGTEKIGAYTCEKVEITFADPGMGKTTLWYSKALDATLRHVSEGSYGSTAMEVTNIREKAVDDALFQVPQGYRKMTMPGGGTGPGRER